MQVSRASTTMTKILVGKRHPVIVAYVPTALCVLSIQYAARRATSRSTKAIASTPGRVLCCDKNVALAAESPVVLCSASCPTICHSLTRRPGSHGIVESAAACAAVGPQGPFQEGFSLTWCYKIVRCESDWESFSS